MPKLTEDIKSNKRPEHFYGRKGEDVFIVRHCGNVCLVENAKKDRYSVETRQLTDIEPTLTQSAAPASAAPNKPNSNRASASKRAAVPINQKNLFE